MIRSNGPQEWTNIHCTMTTKLADLIDVDNSSCDVRQPTGFSLLQRAASDLDGLIQKALKTGNRIRGLGSSWALTDIAVTRGWLVNTKQLNGCFDLYERYFDPSYPPEKQPLLVLAQCGISIGELNAHLEQVAPSGFARSLKTAGVGAGQTIAGAISGNTHGAAVKFGATSDYVVGLQVVTGNGRSLWIERASYPVLNDDFLRNINAERLRDDDVFNAAVVSLGAFGMITAVAIETEKMYQLKFRPIRDCCYADLKDRLNHFNYDDPPDLYHYEFIFDPYSRTKTVMEAVATKIPPTPAHRTPKPMWIIRDDKGFAPGDSLPALALKLHLFAGANTSFQYDLYRKTCLLNDVTGTPGQLYTATVSYLKGDTECAIGVRIDQAAKMLEISEEVVKQMSLPAIAQVRAVKSTSALLGFTSLSPTTLVFEYGLANDDTFPAFQEKLLAALEAEQVAYTLHWSKNAGIDRGRLEKMYGQDRIDRWRKARRQVFQNNESLMQVFDNDHLVRAGLA
jgi:FAD/FMN-containing dehydrogenase